MTVSKQFFAPVEFVRICHTPIFTIARTVFTFAVYKDSLIGQAVGQTQQLGLNFESANIAKRFATPGCCRPRQPTLIR